MPANQANVEYFFRLIYDLTHGGINLAAYYPLLTKIWNIIIVVGYAFSILGMLVIVYSLIKLFEVREREETFYKTLIPIPVAGQGKNPRWAHVQDLMHSASPADWREAIIEADIVLEEALIEQGIAGDTVGEKLQNLDRAQHPWLSDAWDAHLVRNKVAHQGSTFDLSPLQAQRTIAQFENVFRALGTI